MLPLMFASTLEGRSSRQLQADRRGPAPGCRGTRHNEGCQRCGFPPIRAPAHLLVGPSHHSRLQGAGWPRGRVQHPCTFGDLSDGQAPACRNPVAGRPPLSERLHLIVLLPIPPPPPPDSVGDRHHGLVNQPIQCGGNRAVCWTDAQAPCQDRREAAELWNPVAAHLLCLGAVCAVGAPRLHFCTSASHLQCHPSVFSDFQTILSVLMPILLQSMSQNGEH